MGDPTALRQSSGSYQYLPLDEEAREIRLLSLLPGPFSSPIRVILETTAFSPDTPPHFEALSYAWGTAENPIDIFVGSSGYYTLPVTQNLAEALPYLRLEDRPRTLWIDAICVNQSDMAERTSQVKRMGDIYSKAIRVVVWLGLASEDSSMAFDVFDFICSKITVDWQTYSLQPISADTCWVDSDVPLSMDEAQSNSVSNLLNRPWFKRLWVWQEIHLSPGDTIVMCGDETIRWSSVCQTVFYLHTMPLSVTNQDLKTRIISIWQLCDRQDRGYVPFTVLLYDTAYCECSDPRDRIFALLSLLHPSERVFGIEADYSKTVLEVYKNATLCTIKFNEDLEIMQAAGLKRRNSGLPSWVPDWACRATTTSLGSSVKACGATLAADIGHQGYEGILQVTGVAVATIDRVEGFKLSEASAITQADVIHEIRRIASWVNLPGLFEKDSEDLLAFCRTIFTDGFAESDHPQKSHRPSLKECLQTLLFILGHEGIMNDRNKKSLSIVAGHASGRSFFVTKDERLGIGPIAAKPGDIVTVFLGGHIAFILRPTDGGRYQVVGEAYCHGFMDAEALLGPLPRRFQLVRKRDPKTRTHWWGHMGRMTERFYCEDPRLGELPSGWKRRAHPLDEFWTWFVNEETGQEMKGGDDPRLTDEALKQRGVDLKVFEL
ncbi:HET-domain-containing protein, partial [Stipitochalara longipes BDJ]